MCQGLADLGCLVKNKIKKSLQHACDFLSYQHIASHFLRCPRTKIYFVFGVPETTWLCNSKDLLLLGSSGSTVETVIFLKMSSVYWSKNHLSYYLVDSAFTATTKSTHSSQVRFSNEWKFQFGIFWTISSRIDIRELPTWVKHYQQVHTWACEVLLLSSF